MASLMIEIRCQLSAMKMWSATVTKYGSVSYYILYFAIILVLPNRS